MSVSERNKCLTSLSRHSICRVFCGTWISKLLELLLGSKTYKKSKSMRKLKRSHHFDFMYIKKSAYEPNGPSGRRLIIPFSVAGSDMEYFYSPLDRMLVHRRVNPIIRFVCTHSYTWVERGTVRVKCFAQENSTMSPSVLTMRTPRLSSRFYKLLIIHLLWEHIIDTLHIKLSEFASVTPFVQVLPSSVLCSCRFFLLLLFTYLCHPQGFLDHPNRSNSRSHCNESHFLQFHTRS